MDEKNRAERAAALRSELTAKIGQGIVDGLLTPREAAGMIAGVGGARSYSQNGDYWQDGGPYTQSGGDHNQSGDGGYTKS